MSKHLEPAKYTGKALEQQLLNCMISCHDLCCGCDTPVLHINNLTKPAKWHLTKTTGTTTRDDENGDAADDFNLDEGDLRALFDAEQEDER